MSLKFDSVAMKCFCRIFFLLLVIIMTGCYSSACFRRGESPLSGIQIDELAGSYTIKSFTCPDFNMDDSRLRQDKIGARLFSGGDDTIPLIVNVTYVEGNGESSVINVLLSAFTLLVWPISGEMYRDYEVTVESCLGVDKVRFTLENDSMMSSSPLGWCAQLVHWKSKCKTGLDHEGKLWKEVGEESVVQAILSVLSRGKYEAHFAKKRQRQEEVNRKLEDGRRKKREAMLRDFALKEAPAIWQTLQMLRAELTDTTKRIEKLKGEIIGFGRDPVQDADFLEICKMRDLLKMEQMKLWKKLEDAYFAYVKFKAMPGSKETADIMKKAVESGITEAESMKRRFEKMATDK